MATTGIAMQGLSAAIVYTAIDKIGKMITDAEGRMQSRSARPSPRSSMASRANPRWPKPSTATACRPC